MKRIFFAFALCIAFAISVAAEWNVVPCEPATAAKRAQYAAGVRGAAPGSPLYVRIPFPSSDAEIITNLTEHVIGVYGAAATSRFHAIADGMKRGVYDYEVLRVADWTPGRCAVAGNGGDFYFLIVIRDPAGAEVARASQFATGRFRALALPDSHVDAVEPLVRANAKLAARGIHGRDAQHVSTWGTLSCHPLRPCVAMRNQDGIFVLHNDDVWLLPVGGRIHSMRKDLPDEASRARFIATLRADERFVTLGGDAAVVATRVK